MGQSVLCGPSFKSFSAPYFPTRAGTDPLTQQASSLSTVSSTPRETAACSPPWPPSILAAFDIEIGNLSNPNALPAANSQQEGVSKLDGVELEARLLLGDVSLELNASRIDTRDPNGLRFASVPQRQASAWLSWRPQSPIGWLGKTP